MKLMVFLAVFLFFCDRNLFWFAITISRKALHLVASNRLFKNCIISVIYNSSHFCNQCFLWHELSKIAPLQLPWLVLGDLNAELSMNEHKGRNFMYYDRKARFFKDFVVSNNLLDLNFFGPSYIGVTIRLALLGGRRVNFLVGH